MTPARWERVQTIFHHATRLSQAEQSEFVTSALHDDPELISEVQQMLQADSLSNSLLNRGLPDLALRLVATSLDLGPGSIVGHYSLKSRVGLGGMGVVFAAERTDTGKLVAMKFLLGAAMSPLRRALFIQEMHTHANLTHPNIAVQYDAGELADGTPWFAMEHVHGLHFLTYFETHRSSLKFRLEKIREVCLAVEYLRSKGIVHCDLKPSNILIDAAGNPRLLDFGIARQVSTLGNARPQPSAPVQLMTPSYAAPEWTELGVVDHSTDVYALGVILCQALTGSHPSAIDLTHGDSDHQFVPARKSQRVELRKILNKATQSSPGERYNSVEALRRDLDHFSRNEALEGIPGTPVYHASKFAARHSQSLLASFVAALCFLAMIGFFAARLTRERNIAVSESNRSKLVEQFLSNLFQGGNKTGGPAASLRVLTLLDSAIEQANSLHGDPQLQAELYHVLGGIYEQLGDLDKAQSLLSKALSMREIERQNQTKNAATLSETLLSLASVREDQAQFDDALRLAIRAQTILKSASPPDPVALARANRIMARIKYDQGAIDAALPLLKNAQQVFTNREDAKTDLAATLVTISDCYFSLSRYPAALDTASKALALHESLVGKQHPLVAIDLRNIGNIQISTGQPRIAEDYFRRALTIEEAWYTSDHPDTADMQVYVAQALKAQGRLTEAEPLLQDALLTMKRHYRPPHPRVALVLNEIGMLQYQKGDLKAALEFDQQAAQMYQLAFGEQNQQTLVAENNVASNYLWLRDYQPARKIFEHTLHAFDQIHMDKTLNAGITRLKLGRTLARLGKYREAEVQLQTGCSIVSQYQGPSSPWIVAVRPDLETVRAALNH